MPAKACSAICAAWDSLFTIGPHRTATRILPPPGRETCCRAGSLLSIWPRTEYQAQNTTWKDTWKGSRENNPGFFLDRIANHLVGANLEPSLEVELLKTLERSSTESPRQTAEIALAGMLASPAFQWR